MGLEVILPYLWQYGIAGVVAGILLWLLARVLKNFMEGLKEDRANYMGIIERQQKTEQNHIAHLEAAIHEQRAEIKGQGQQFTNGIDKLCTSIDHQTEVLKAHIKKE